MWLKIGAVANPGLRGAWVLLKACVKKEGGWDIICMGVSNELLLEKEKKNTHKNQGFSIRFGG